MSAVLRFAPLSSADLPRAFALETASYPADEAATEAKLQMRLSEAGEYFYGAYSDAGALCGFVCGTLTTSDELTDESMSVHEPAGRMLCIHSVVVDQALRRQGVGSQLLGSYLQTDAVARRRVQLICKDQLVGFYQAAGFVMLGPSTVVHGQDQWLLMSKEPAIAFASQ